MVTKIHIKKGDTVRVIAGNAKNEEGKVLSIDKKKYRALVEGVNMQSKHTKPNAKTPQGGIVKKEGSIHISNLKVIDAAGNATRIGRKRDEATNKIVRFSKKSTEVIK